MYFIPLIAALAVSAPAPQNFKLQVTTVPAKAEVILNGNSVGKAGLTTNLTSGNYKLTIRKEGFRNYALALSHTNSESLFIRLSATNSHFYFQKQFKTGHQPKDLIYSPDGRYLMIALLADDGLQIYDMLTGETHWVKVKRKGNDIGFVEGIFTDDGKEFWFTQVSSKGRVFVLSMEDFTIKKEIMTQGDWTKVGEFSPDGKFYYVSNWISHDITVIDRKTYEFVRKVKTPGKAPRGIAFSDDGRYLYVVFYDSGEIMKFDIQDNYKLVKRIVTGGTNGRFRIDRKKQIAYVNNMRLGRFFVYDLKSDTIIKEVRTWINPDNIKLAPGNRYIFVSDRGPNNTNGYELRSPENGRIQVFDAESNYTLVENLEAGNQPIGIAITPDLKNLAICNFKDDTVELYSIML